MIQALWIRLADKLTKRQTQKAYVDPMMIVLDRILTAEVNAINVLCAESGVNTQVVVEKSTFSDTGNFVRYKLSRTDRVNKIKALAGDIGELLTAMREQPTPCKFGQHGLSFDVPFPLDPKILEWDDADLDKLLPMQSLMGMDYTEMMPAVLDYSDDATSNVMLSGTTGSGKTSMLIQMITSMCYGTSPKDLHFILLDAKPDDDFEPLANLPHVTMYRDIAECVTAIASVREELDRRGGNKDRRKIILVIDEYAELKNKVTRNFDAKTFQAMESDLGSISQTGRSKGIHIFLSTQKAVTDVIDTVFRGNLPCRIGGKVTTREESYVAMGRDGIGCELLKGKGSFYYTTGSMVNRIQSYLIHKNEVRPVTRGVAARWHGVQPLRINMLDVTGVTTASRGEVMGKQHQLVPHPDPASAPKPATVKKVPAADRAAFVLEHIGMEDLFNADGSTGADAPSQIAKLFFGPTAHGRSTQFDVSKETLQYIHDHYYVAQEA